jgi:putative acetyltransferase
VDRGVLDGVTVRRYRESDAAPLCALFVRSVREIGPAKYDATQVGAWAHDVPDPAAWDARMRERETFVAVNDDGTPAGWIELEADGHVDMLYCAPEAAGRGVAAQLYAVAESFARERGLPRLTSDASRFAESFFRKHGWNVDERETVTPLRRRDRARADVEDVTTVSAAGFYRRMTTAAVAGPVPARTPFDELYRTEFRRVVAIAQRIVADHAEAEDVAQDVFTALAARPDVVARPASLHVAAVRRALNAVRSRRRRTARESATVLTAGDAAAQSGVDPLDALVRDERLGAIRTVMRRLKRRDAALLALRYGGELSYREIAAALDVPAPHVGTLLARAKRAFVREVHRAPRVVALALAATMACALAVLAFPAARSYATSLLEELRPARLVAKLVAPHARLDLNAILGPYATYHWDGYSAAPRRGPLVASPADAQRWTGFRVRVPVDVPGELAARRRAYVLAGGAWTYRFDRARAARHGAHLPRSLDGATISAAFATHAELRYGDGRVLDVIPGFAKPALVVFEAPVPIVTVRGATLASITRWLESDPGVPRSAADDVRRFADPLLALPVPVRADREHAANVVVQGAPGIAVSTAFGASNVVVWQKDGVVYAVGGTYPLDRVLAIANSLR